MPVAFDRDIYDRLDEQTDGAAGEILALYLSLLPERKAEMMAAWSAGDWGELKRHAHKLKSGSFTLGLLRLGELCETIEHKIAAGHPLPTEMAAAIAEEFDAARALVAEIVRE